MIIKNKVGGNSVTAIAFIYLQFVITAPCMYSGELKLSSFIDPVWLQTQVAYSCMQVLIFFYWYMVFDILDIPITTWRGLLCRSFHWSECSRSCQGDCLWVICVLSIVTGFDIYLCEVTESIAHWYISNLLSSLDNNILAEIIFTSLLLSWDHTIIRISSQDVL